MRFGSEVGAVTGVDIHPESLVKDIYRSLIYKNP